ncbi:hypothetical protein HDU77_001013 [Chytriomyces hyalinus]|nr:hypothetical protein HDU77_001013 [Chytriomyces hyalinus]
MARLGMASPLPTSKALKEKGKLPLTNTLVKDGQAVPDTVQTRPVRQQEGPKSGLNPLAAEFVPLSASAKGLNIDAAEFYPLTSPRFFYYY